MQPTLVFAGEHCHNSFYSTVHGAYLSGRDAAHCIAEAINSTPASAAASAAATKVVAGSDTSEFLSAGASGVKSPSSCGSQPEHDMTLVVEGTADLSSWLHGISLN